MINFQIDGQHLPLVLGQSVVAALIERIDVWAAKHGCTRPDAIRAMVEAAEKRGS